MRLPNARKVPFLGLALKSTDFTVPFLNYFQSNSPIFGHGFIMSQLRVMEILIPATLKSCTMARAVCHAAASAQALTAAVAVTTVACSCNLPGVSHARCGEHAHPKHTRHPKTCAFIWQYSTPYEDQPSKCDSSGFLSVESNSF